MHQFLFIFINLQQFKILTKECLASILAITLGTCNNNTNKLITIINIPTEKSIKSNILYSSVSP